MVRCILGDNMRQVAWFCFFLASLALAAPAAARDLTAKDLKVFIGKAGRWETLDGKFRGTARWNRDGSQTMTSSDPTIVRDTGRWSIEGDNWCSKWSKAYRSRKRCGVIREVRPGVYKIGNFITRVP